MRKPTSRLFLALLAAVALVAASVPLYAGSAPLPQPVLPLISTAGTPPAPAVDDPLSDFDCSQVAALGIDRQLNMRASLIRIHCGIEPAGSILPGTAAPSSPAFAADYGGTDAQVNNALADPWPHVTQAGTSFAAHGQRVVAAYNSSTAAPGNYSGVSYSVNGGATYTETRPSPFTTGHGTNFGSSSVLYSNRQGLFFAFWLNGGGDCGSQGIGSWTSADGVNWTPGPCAHGGTSDDRGMAWVDNDPSSPFYGYLYVAWNDFSVGGGAPVVARSTDYGATWSAPLILNATFMRIVQGASGPGGGSFVAVLDEGGGGTNPRQNWIYASTDGGATFSGTTMGGTFTAPGDLDCGGYFRAISPIWRYMGWGSLDVGPGGVLHYAYGAGGVGDIGNILYVRSTDAGLTWSAPVQLNTDAGTRAQWGPSLSVTPNGRVLVSWYDRRNTTNDDYQRFARASLDNGATWEPDQALSDQVIPQPAQADPAVSACYAGDYDHSAASGMAVYGGWTDGRVPISATAQEDVYADRVDLAPPALCAPPYSAWQLVAGLPQGVYGPAVATDGRYVYAAGGYDFSAAAPLPQFARYDPATNVWTLLNPLPTAVSDALGAFVDGKIYVLGGQNGATAENLTQIYDIASNSWSAGAPLPGPRQQQGGGVYNGKIYVTGGYSTTSAGPSDTANETWEYDPAANNWATRTNIPTALGGPASAVIGGHLYVAGGRDPTHFALDTLYDYDIAANSWAARATLPTAVNVAAGADFAGRMWVMGGGTPFLGSSAVPEGAALAPGPDAMSTVQIYDPATDSWSAGPSQNVARSFQEAATVGGTIVSVGGYDGGASTPVTESFLQQRLRVLVLYADAVPSFQNQLLSLPGVALVDLFNAQAATPTPAQLQGYDEVVVWSDLLFADSVTLGNELADFVDNGGVVVELAFDFYGAGYYLGGRWQTGGYAAFNVNAVSNFATASLGTVHVPGSPLLAGVGGLTAFYRENTTAVAGATLIADWSDTNPALAVKGRVVGLTGYFGDNPPAWSGGIARLVANAGFSLRSPGSACVPLQGLAAANNSPTELGQPTLLTATVSAGSLPVTYTWALGDGTSFSGASPAHTYPAAGLYTALVTASNPVNMLTATTVVSVYCVLPHAITFTWVPANPLAGQAVDFSGAAGGTAPVAFSWAFGDGGTGSGATVSHTYTVAGTFTVALTATNGCGTGQTMHSLTVTAPTTMWKIYLPIVMKNATP